MAFWKKSGPSPATAFDPTHRFVTSWLLPPGVLFAVRALLSLYAFTTIFFIFGWYGTHGQTQASERSFSYFTNLTYWGLAFYFAFSAVHTGSYWLTGSPFLTRWPRFLQNLHSIFYTTIVVFPWLVTIIFWALLYSRFYNEFQTWTNTSQHALNSVFAFVEIILPRTAPLPFFHIVPLIILLALYLGLAYLTYDTQHFFVYSFLNNKTHSKGVIAGYCIGILVVTIIIFLLVRYLIWSRIWITEKQLGLNGKLSSRPGQRLTSPEEGKEVGMMELPVRQA
ncbi:uncharacterized protein BDZ99DRAFT_445656 [Mytilinidion resinicola]|uniref:FAR-17a/AIG1-like protein n=1 Tax=Mytilinidion resinicola TaxID=574789 RepID=A0A6A6YK71_9PEZI|nr:uncharacterized protein BDZ99DRAFT_445656 [Mytilinidion resinicola]KAF2808317.1 hypothetical protein BDZ99DRAFT_445656 [Mytilinidion resinicola]